MTLFSDIAHLHGESRFWYFLLAKGQHSPAQSKEAPASEAIVEEFLRQQDAEGDPNSLLLLASLFREGVPGYIHPDPVQRERWLVSAAEKDCVPAMMELASVYQNQPGFFFFPLF